ncbi:MAG TPA: helix-turn-helix transcriptional regulator, partial [Terriglobia bacterium]|nr:helix-turn-helix transcriptional regulator [Terriglobia bacterium]
LERHLRLFILEAAIAGGWIGPPTDKSRTEIFSGGYLGYESNWREFRDGWWHHLLAANTAEWKGRLLEAEANDNEPIKSASRAGQSVASQLTLLKEECHLTAEELAELTEMDVRSVQRHLAGDTGPRGRHLRKYEKVFSKLLNRHVVISTMP